jgi:hypothetical protein
MTQAMDNIRVWAAGLALCVGGGVVWAQAAPALKLVTILALDRPVMVAERQLLDLAFARAGLRFTLEHNPAERALAGFLNGSFDGDVNRIGTFNQSHPGAIRVEPHIQSAFFYAVGHAVAHPPADWQSLGRFRIAYVRGFKGIEIRTAAVAAREVTDSDEACLRMAQARRVDWCVLPADRRGDWPLHARFGDPLVGVLIDAVQVYVWLGPQYSHHAGQLTRALREMQRSGELQSIMGPFRQAD